MKRDAETHAKTKEMIEGLRKETKMLQDDVIYGRGASKFVSLSGAYNTSYGNGFVSLNAGGARAISSRSELGMLKENSAGILSPFKQEQESGNKRNRTTVDFLKMADYS